MGASMSGWWRALRTLPAKLADDSKPGVKNAYAERVSSTIALAPSRGSASVQDRGDVRQAPADGAFERDAVLPWEVVLDQTRQRQ